MCVCVWMDGWMDEWADVRADGSVCDGWTRDMGRGGGGDSTVLAVASDTAVIIYDTSDMRKPFAYITGVRMKR